MKEMLYEVRCLKSNEEMILALRPWHSFKIALQLVFSSFFLLFKLPHFDRSGAITVIMDFAHHKLKRMITDPNMNDI